ncbi:uncharacterized protein EURHEDRAFT_295615 [Aspergillus ruber CBS 135680]|uniref:Uncharacterized protein n=1 Tax=Aspergillus ruber (strain CBS 135680) TaxID=1388766 RepID=A0A017SMI0_ASPRC|nr:uncharacterized protein EURHEDRAFT_295615 [Aspergillus ruber CBS 135680]EYE97480.1 hypothetical protein EURHEDRAFT_295615 [Aspergillus ruber CBS 135680]
MIDHNCTYRPDPFPPFPSHGETSQTLSLSNSLLSFISLLLSVHYSFLSFSSTPHYYRRYLLIIANRCISLAIIISAAGRLFFQLSWQQIPDW